MRIINLVVSLLILFTLAACSPKTPASDQSKTIVTPHMEQALSNGKNVLYCSSFQIAWNILCDEVLKDKVQLEGNPQISHVLNKQLATKKDVAETDYVAKAGILTSAFLEDLNKAIKSKFGAQVTLPIHIPERQTIIAYAFLQSTLQFEKAFNKLVRPVVFNYKGKEVLLRGFGIDSLPGRDGSDIEQLRNQVTVFNYKDDDNFIIGLSTKSPDEQIILAKIIPGKTLLETVRNVDTKVLTSSRGAHLQEDEPLCIPAIELDKIQTFDELKGRRITNQGPFNNFVLAEALQQIKFRLNENGALLRSEALIEAPKAAGNPDTKRTFIFDKPFLIYLKHKKAQYPYFALWVDNPEVLVTDNTGEPGVFIRTIGVLCNALYRGMTTVRGVISGAK